MVILYFFPTNVICRNLHLFILLNKYNKKFINLKYYKLVKNKNYYLQ